MRFEFRLIFWLSGFFFRVANSSNEYPLWATRRTDKPDRGINAWITIPRHKLMPLFFNLLPYNLYRKVRTALSPRFLPNEIVHVTEIPRTLSGKKQELPIKKLMLGQPIEKVINKEAMANPGCLEWYVAFARQHLAKGN